MSQSPPFPGPSIPSKLLPLLFPPPARTEKIRLDFSLDVTKADQHREALEVLLGEGNVPRTCAGDTLKFFYSLCAEYFGDVERKLRAVLTIVQDEAVIIEAEVNELNHGESLILKVGAALRDVQIAMEKRRQPPPKKPSLWQRLVARWQS